jgi:type II secretory pathway pseudopilin PulG
MKTTRNILLFQKCKRRLAFTMVESMLLVAILGMTAAVVGQSLTTMASSAVRSNLTLQINDQLLSQMEYLRSVYNTVSPAPTSSAPWTSTSTVIINGANYTMNSQISLADPGSGSAQSNFLVLQATIGSQTMSTYVSE